MVEMIASADELRAWAARAVPGQAIVYFHGFLAIERSTFDPATRSHGVVEPIDELANAALELAGAGVINLCQRRNGVGWEYLAQRRSKTR
jgi:hypothetical protein